MIQRSYLGKLTIANGGTASNILGHKTLNNCRAVMFFTPSAFTGTVTLKAGQQPDTVVGSHITVKAGGSDVTLTAARAHLIEFLGGFGSLSLLSGSAEGAERVVDVWAILDS